MNRRSIIGLSTVAALGLALYSSNGVGQSAKDLVGTWTIVSAEGASDMILRNANSGEFEVYDIVEHSDHDGQQLRHSRAGLVGGRIRR